MWKKKEPCSVSKALHLLALAFFPLWDDDISRAYSCYWYSSSQASEKYIKFMKKIKLLTERILTEFMNRKNVDKETASWIIRKEASSNTPFVKSLVKIIDEFNYAYTKYY